MHLKISFNVVTISKELNAGQHIFEWKFFTEKGVYELFYQKRVDIVITKSVITHFRVFYYSKSCRPAFNSLKEWKFTLLHLRRHFFSGRFMKNFRFDTICNITQEPQELQRCNLCMCSSTSLL